MSQKAWVITLESDQKPETLRILDVISARKKINVIDTYLAEIYRLLNREDGASSPVTRISGASLSLSNPAFILRAHLSEIENAVYQDDQIHQANWKGLSYERFEISSKALN